MRPDCTKTGPSCGVVPRPRQRRRIVSFTEFYKARFANARQEARICSPVGFVACTEEPVDLSASPVEKHDPPQHVEKLPLLAVNSGEGVETCLTNPVPEPI